MGYYDNNPYYSPEKMGLTKVVEIELAEPDYSFDIAAVWRHNDTGVFYAASDSGCSCPTPFEDYDSLDTLTELTSKAAVYRWLDALTSYNEAYFAQSRIAAKKTVRNL